MPKPTCPECRGEGVLAEPRVAAIERRAAQVKAVKLFVKRALMVVSVPSMVPLATVICFGFAKFVCLLTGASMISMKEVTSYEHGFTTHSMVADGPSFLVVMFTGLGVLLGIGLAIAVTDLIVPRWKA